MDYQPSPKLTKDFVERNIPIEWPDLRWAYAHHWLDMKSIAELADALASDDDELRVSIASAEAEGDDSALGSLLEAQARKHPASNETTRERWLALAVKWLYEHRETLDDPWNALEELWVAFDHPPVLNGLIRWMPLPPGTELGEDAMLRRWQNLRDKIGKSPKPFTD